MSICVFAPSEAVFSRPLSSRPLIGRPSPSPFGRAGTWPCNLDICLDFESLEPYIPTLINIPSVAWLFYKHPRDYVFNSLILFLPIFNTLRARELQYLENVHPITMCHRSHVRCHLSDVMCHMSGVTYQVSFFSRTKRFILSVEGLLSTGPTLSSLGRKTKNLILWPVLTIATFVIYRLTWRLYDQPGQVGRVGEN